MKNLTLRIPSLKHGGSLNLKRGSGKTQSPILQTRGPSIGLNETENGSNKQLTENPQIQMNKRDRKQESRQKQQMVKKDILKYARINNNEKKTNKN